MPRETTTIDAPVLAVEAAPAAETPPKAKAASKPKTTKTTKSTKASTAPKAAAKRAPKPRQATWSRARGQKKIIPITGVKDAPTGYHLLIFAHLYTTIVANALHENPATSRLTMPQLMTLHLLSANKDACGAELARAMGVQPQTMTNVTTSLREKGLIQDLGATKGQGRANVMVLTDQGRKALAAGRKVAKTVDAKLSGAYSYDDREEQALVKLLTMGHVELEPERS